MTVVPATAAAAATAISEYFFFKVFPLCRSGDGSLLPIEPVAEILGVGILFRIVFSKFLLGVLLLYRRESPSCYEAVINQVKPSEKAGKSEDNQRGCRP
jgi:hypothetical protein